MNKKTKAIATSIMIVNIITICVAMIEISPAIADSECRDPDTKLYIPCNMCINCDIGVCEDDTQCDSGCWVYTMPCESGMEALCDCGSYQWPHECDLLEGCIQR